MTTKIKAWGNSCGIRIPASVLEDAGMKVEDEINIRVDGSDIVLSKKVRHKSLEERMAAYGGKLRLIKYDWGEPEGREMW